MPDISSHAQYSFSEPLPPQCPPANAVDAAYPKALRLVDASKVDEVCEKEFLSYAALGNSRPNVDPCAFASCSLFESETCKGFKAALKLPKLRGKKIAEISIPQGSGLSTRSSSGHIHFWRFIGFDPIPFVKEVREHANS